MSSLQSLSATEFKNALTPERVRVGMIIQGALGLGGLFYMAAIVAVVALHAPEEMSTESLELLTTLTIVNLAMFVVIGSAGQFLYRSRFTHERLESAYSGALPGQEANLLATPAGRIISYIRTAMLLRTACFEGSAFLGLAVLMIAATDGTLAAASWLWINGVPLLALLMLVVFTFPTANRLGQLFESTIQNAR